MLHLHLLSKDGAPTGSFLQPSPRGWPASLLPFSNSTFQIRTSPLEAYSNRRPADGQPALASPLPFLPLHLAEQPNLWQPPPSRPTPTAASPRASPLPSFSDCLLPLTTPHLMYPPPSQQAYSNRRLAEGEPAAAGGGEDGSQRKGVPHVLVLDHSAASGLGRDKFQAGWVSFEIYFLQTSLQMVGLDLAE